MKSISLSTRVFLLNLVASGAILAALFTYFERIRDASQKADASHRVASLVSEAAMNFDRMTIGMRGFMLDPTLKSEWDAKLEADRRAVAALKAAAEISFNPQVSAGIKEMGAMDETMDALENEFGDLVKQGSFKEANRFYFSNYLPVRQKMEVLLNKVRAATDADSNLYGSTQDKLIVAGSTWVSGSVFGILLLLLGINQWISSRLTGRIAALSEEMSTSAMSIELASKNTASASQQIATSATENASAITETLSMADSGRKESDRGRDVVSAMANAMKEVYESNSRLEGLIRVIEDIKSKTQVINDIVFETRLLSFNASIEAARAGSHGKGFAVVAEEVGKLAAVSGKAAEEINKLLEDSTKQVTDIVTTTSTRVSSAKESSIQCEQVFNQMSISLNEINRAMQDMEKETHQNSASSEELANQASTLAHESKALTSIVVRMRNLVLGRSAEGGAEKPAPKADAGTPKKAKKLNVVVPPPAPAALGTVEEFNSSGERGEADRNDIRWKVG